MIKERGKLSITSCTLWKKTRRYRDCKVCLISCQLSAHFTLKTTGKF